MEVRFEPTENWPEVVEMKKDLHVLEKEALITILEKWDKINENWEKLALAQNERIRQLENALSFHRDLHHSLPEESWNGELC